MESVLKRLQSLTPDQLRDEITGAGLKCGPITATTRSVFEKKLARVLLENHTDGSDAPQMHSESSESSCQELHQPINERNREEMNHDTETTENPETFSENPSVYYGVYPQPDDPSVKDGTVHVFVNKTKALKAVMRMKGARFKAFVSKEDAENFAKGVCEDKSSPEKPNAASVIDAVNVEKANEFRSPRTQDLTAKLRKAVEKGDEETFKELVWENPRYLIGSGDNPTIVQEGCRYNVLHVAAKENQPGITRLILETLENPEFMRLMYPKDQEVMLWQRIRYILDLYLNTPDKASNETPLHFACKFGCPDVVNVLCSHPYVDKNCRNKYDQKPASVICERKNKSKEVKQKIMEYLEDRFYVPLLRAADNTLHPVIGAPWCPGSLESCDQLQTPVIVDSPKNPLMTIKAFAGPLNSSKAEEFHRLWKTPPRDRAKYFHDILKSDSDRGAERVGRELAHEMGVPWAEYWDFLNCFIDLFTADGLNMLEEYLNRENRPINARCSTPSTGGPDRTSSSVCRSFHNEHLNRSFKTTHENSTEEEDPSDIGRFPVCDLMQEFENVLFSTEHTDKTCDSGLGGQTLSSSNDEWRTHQTEDDECSCSSEEYFTADEDSGDLQDCNSSNGGILGHSTPWSRGHVSLDDSGSSNSSFQSTHSRTDHIIDPVDLDRREVFIVGNSPTKLDNDVLLALNNVEIDQNLYPGVVKWKSKILSYPSSQRQSWPAASLTIRDSESRSSPADRLDWFTVSPNFRSPGHFNPEQFVFSPLSRSYRHV
ncbi:ankyrin repeat and LEM domain-containing protein 2-like [Myxocyprinus asiaticus]|uniref:ankyrin repeat and LEM domain-containing protein 2-like n=1 Tax=Myxocyprinus asiaticus TaxID=70543 RepID=UPI0022234678|nr:ankyrin repeat and LEM domain-containing protein 2-like [Myxocyprinus asiaticus]XP_051540668.1 ankyrin repeat and LEM domain-containing protein 2-like [Myxocyprinus asiaticus]